MERDENRDPQQDDEGTEDLEVSSDEAEGVAGGLLRPEDPDMGGQRT